MSLARVLFICFIIGSIGSIQKVGAQPSSASKPIAFDRRVETNEAVHSFERIEQSLGFVRRQVPYIQNEVKLCAGLPDADTKLAALRSLGKPSLILLWVRGETSGSHMLLGTGCQSAVSMSLPLFAAFSRIVEDARKRLNVGRAVEAFAPIDVVEQSDQTLTYKSQSGTLHIELGADGRNITGTFVSAVNKQVLFDGVFDLADY